MTTNYSEEYWKGRFTETNFGGGSAGAAYAKTEPANTAALTSLNYPENETQENPTKEYIHESKEAAGQGVDTVQTFTTDETITDGKMIQAFQTPYYLEAAVDDDGGDLPANSWCEVFPDGNELKAAYGCYVKELSLTFPKAPDLIKEEVTYGAYDVIDVVTDANFSTAKAWDSTNKPGCTASITIDTVLLNHYQDATLTISKEFREKGAGCGLHKYPYLVKRTIELEVNSDEYIKELKDLEVSTVTPFTIVIVITYAATTRTLTLTNMRTKESNIREIPSKGMKTNSITFEIGGVTTAVITT